MKYVTPYAYCEASNVISEAKLESNLVIIGIVISVLGVIAAYVKYTKKDIAS